MTKRLLSLILILIAFKGQAEIESTKPKAPLNTLGLAARIASKLGENMHLRIIGACLWLNDEVPPKLIPGPAISEFIPDLVVTVSNNPGENPIIEVNELLENNIALKGYQAVFKKAVGSPLGFGNGSTLINPSHLNQSRTRVVTVLGSPLSSVRLPDITHNPETRFPDLYYSSLMDAVMDRTEAAELAYMATHPFLLAGHEIGSSTNYWGYEVPRLMTISQPYRFRASFVAAHHAADIVTNEQSLHIAKSTTNSCGPSCVIANVVFDPKQKNIIWQEVYPENRNIVSGAFDDFGIKDDKKGNGNYVFVVWRKYKGCVKQEGQLITGINVGSPQKR